MRSPPPDVVASWPAPNYINPETRGPGLVVVEIVALCISTMFLGLRMYVRVHIMRSVDWDDWLMIAGAILGVGVTVCVVLAATRYGWDLHVWDLTTAKMVSSRQVSFACQTLFCMSTALVRTSIFTSYLRLAPRRSWFRRLTFVGISASVLTGVVFTIALFVQCRPMSSYWNLTLYSRDCYNEVASLMAYSVIAAVLDFFVWVLPLPTLYSIKLPLSQRLALVTLFSFGLVVVIAACFRIYWVHYVLLDTYDVTWYGWDMWIWTAVEVQLGLICGCVPWLKSLFKFWKTGQTIAGSSGPTTLDAQRVTGSKRITAVRMESLGKAWTNDQGPGKGEYIDLERSSAGGDSQAELNKTSQ